LQELSKPPETSSHFSNDPGNIKTQSYVEKFMKLSMCLLLAILSLASGSYAEQIIICVNSNELIVIKLSHTTGGGYLSDTASVLFSPIKNGNLDTNNHNEKYEKITTIKIDSIDSARGSAFVSTAGQKNSISYGQIGGPSSSGENDHLRMTIDGEKYQNFISKCNFLD
jgi:hypothetical protein